MGGEVTLGDTDEPVYAIAAGDLDRDGDLDLVSSGMLAWNNSYTATFSSPWVSATLAAGVRAQDVAIHDLDQDGDLDMVAGGNFGLAIWQNPWDQGNSTPFGTWPVSRVLTTAQTVKAVVVADLDNDGRLDIVARYDELTWGCIGMWRNPDTPFSTPWAMSVTMNAGARVALVAVGDLDHDGDVDVVSADAASSSPPDGEVQWWQNDGSPFDGGWSYAQTWGTGIGFYDLLLADLNKNGDLDTIVSGETASERGRIVTWVALWQRVYLPVVLR